MADSCFCCACISTGEVGIVERNCKYNRLALPGISLMCWPFENLRSRVSLRVMQLDIRAETKTKDNVFVMLYISVQYNVRVCVCVAWLVRWVLMLGVLT